MITTARVELTGQRLSRQTVDGLANLGTIFIAVSLVAFGVQHFVYRGYVKGLELLPEWLPAHNVWAYLAGAALILAGISFLTGQRARLAAMLLGACLLLCALVYHTPMILTIGGDVGERTRLFETLAICGGVWFLASVSPNLGAGWSAWNQLAGKLATAGRLLIAVSMIVFGFGHFQVAKFVATLIPAWIPLHLFWVYFTAIGFIAAGVSFAAGKHMRPMGLLLGLMFSLWVVLLHAPRIARALHNGNEWNSGFVALTMAGCALLLAGTRAASESR